MGGVLAISISIYRVCQDKLVKGIHWGMLIFFISWSTWNLFLYYHVGLWLSVAAGSLMVFTESIYLFLLLYYSKEEKLDGYADYLRLEFNETPKTPKK
jgi:hypothetical protein